MEIQQHNDTLKQAMLLLENKQTEQNKELEKDKKPWWKILS